MNKDNMLKLAAVIEPLEHYNDFYGNFARPQFGMNYIKYNCGTPACIAGWATACALDTRILPSDTLIVEEKGAEWLGLPDDWAHENLFFPSEHMQSLIGEDDYSSITPKVAAAVLRELADVTGDLPTGDAMTEVWSSAFAKGA